MAAPKPPVYSDFFGGKTPPSHSLSNVAYFLSMPDMYKSTLDQITGAVGSIDNYIKGQQAYEAAYQDYLLNHAKYVVEDYYGQELSQDRVDFYTQQKEDVVNKAAQEAEAAKSALRYQVTPEMQKQADQDPYYAAQIGNPDLLKLLIDNPDEAYKLRLDDRSNRINKIRSELENQYNNLVAADSRFGYAGRNSDLPTVFNQQAAQLADAGVMSIGDLRIKDGQLYDNANRRVVTNSNLGGQVYTDRDTGVQKWGDIFSNVKGGANYGIMQAPDGSVLLFPAYEKSKSLAAQIGGKDLEKWITPLLTVGGAVIGVPGLGAVGGAAAGAAAGSTTGQLLASGKVDWEKVALSAAGAGAGQAIFGGAGAEAPAAAEAGATAATSTAVPGSFQAALPELGVQTAATTAGATAVPGSFAAALPSLLTPVNALGDTAQGLLNQDLEFISADAAQLWKQTGDVAAVQQNLIAAGVDPIMAAEASNLAALGGTTQSIASSLGQAFPGETVFTSEGLLSGGSTMDDFAKKIGGDISSNAAPALGIQDALRMARTGMQLFGPQQQQLLGSGGYGGGGGQAAGVDASGLLALLQGRAGVPGVSSLLSPVVSPMAQPQPLLATPVPQYQPLLGTTTQSLLG